MCNHNVPNETMVEVQVKGIPSGKMHKVGYRCNSCQLFVYDNKITEVGVKYKQERMVAFN